MHLSSKLMLSIFPNLIEERKCTSLPNSPAKRVSPTKKKQFFINQAVRNSDLTPRAKGKKSQRRQENSKFSCLSVGIFHSAVDGRQHIFLIPTSLSERVQQSQPLAKQYFINMIQRCCLFVFYLPPQKGRYLANLLEKDECSKDEAEVCSDPALPSIFTEACTNGNYVEVGFYWSQQFIFNQASLVASETR